MKTNPLNQAEKIFAWQFELEIFLDDPDIAVTDTLPGHVDGPIDSWVNLITSSLRAKPGNHS